MRPSSHSDWFPFTIIIFASFLCTLELIFRLEVFLKESHNFRIVYAKTFYCLQCRDAVLVPAAALIDSGLELFPL